MTIGERIRARRTELGITVNELANKLGKNRATIYRYENNEIENIPAAILEPLSNILNTTPDVLCGIDNELCNKKAPSYIEEASENADILLILKALRKLSPEQAIQLRKYVQFMFPEAFD